MVCIIPEHVFDIYLVVNYNCRISLLVKMELYRKLDY